MLNKFLRFAWFLSSYAPLWVILSINNLLYDETLKAVTGVGLLTFLFLGLAIAPSACILLYLGSYRKSPGSQKVSIKNPKIISDLSREYIVTYAISLIGFNLLDIRQSISFCLLIVFFAYLYVKYDTIIYNPILELFNYRMFNADAVQLNLPQISNDEYQIRKNITIITNRKAIEFIDRDIYMLHLNDEGDLFIEAHKKRQ